MSDDTKFPTAFDAKLQIFFDILCIFHNFNWLQIRQINRITLTTWQTVISKFHCCRNSAIANSISACAIVWSGGACQHQAAACSDQWVIIIWNNTDSRAKLCREQHHKQALLHRIPSKVWRKLRLHRTRHCRPKQRPNRIESMQRQVFDMHLAPATLIESNSYV